MVGPKAVAAVGGALLISGALGGYATFHLPGDSPVSYELAAGSVPESQRIAEDLIRSLSATYAPAKTAVFIQPARISFGNPLPAVFNPRHWDAAPASFGWELERALRQRGFAVQPHAADPGLPLVYVLDRIGKAGYRAGVCVAQDWCVGRLYWRDAAGTLIPAGATVRNGSRA